MAGLADWIGRTERREDLLTQGLIDRLRATIDSAETGPLAPQGTHWCLCLPDAPTAELGEDGHPARGGFLPPVPLPRRMWAASDVTFHAPLFAGAAIARTSRVAAIDEKQGRSGQMVFVTVEHRIEASGALAISERQSIVFREPPAPGEGRSAAQAPAVAIPPVSRWRRSYRPGPTMLMRFSALTFNSHRIHYDLPYAIGEEGYPGLVVHGPLNAVMLLDLAARAIGPNSLTRFAFRAQAPAFAGSELVLDGDPASIPLALRVVLPDGSAAMTAEAWR